MKKIAHVIVLPKMAGSQKFCHALLSKINGYKKYILVSGCENVDIDQRQEFINAFESINVEIIWCYYLKRNIGKSDIRGFIELYTIFKKYQFDIVHTNSTKPGILARIAARMSGVKKIVHTVHGISFYKGQNVIKRLIYWAIECVALQFGDINVCVNNYYLKYYKKFFWKKNISVFNGYDFSELLLYANSNNVKCNNKKDNVFSFLFVGRLDIQKDPITLIKAFSILASKYPYIILDIVGDGELMEASKELACELGVKDLVRFHGWIKKPYSYFYNCNAFVCPSLYEAFGFIFVEAAYFRKPIIATNVEGIPEVVLNNKMGFLVSPSNYLALAEKMEILVNSRSLCKVMGDFGSRYVIENFDIQKCVKAYQSIYDNDLR
ncbi:glycosyltransferase family 4 protein [Salmonella enterica]|nr:glycosyltransferase family 1 protein [Salmonella enterica]EBK2973338.1 glycosyltransferase family 1 protein [Salmonella enterica]EBP9775275.1 glycosyltransferase family 4 protein [Salmonella enterica]EBR7329299.1 glycosyltransferase family 4 protein [Salmonella enterica]EJD0488419.1 glycosyltransferase family 4 protein [Salmonella enterica]